MSNEIHHLFFAYVINNVIVHIPYTFHETLRSLKVAMQFSHIDRIVRAYLRRTVMNQLWEREEVDGSMRGYVKAARHARESFSVDTDIRFSQCFFIGYLSCVYHVCWWYFALVEKRAATVPNFPICIGTFGLPFNSLHRVHRGTGAFFFVGRDYCQPPSL